MKLRKGDVVIFSKKHSRFSHEIGEVTEVKRSGNVIIYYEDYDCDECELCGGPRMRIYPFEFFEDKLTKIGRL